MAAPVVASTSSFSASSNATVHTCSWPSGLAVGDLVVAIVSLNDGFQNTWSGTADLNWSRARLQTNGLLSTEVRYRLWTGTEPANFTTSHGSCKGTIRIYRITGSNTGARLNITSVGSSGNDTLDPPNLTAESNWPSGDDVLFLGIGSWLGATGATFTGSHSTGYSGGVTAHTTGSPGIISHWKTGTNSAENPDGSNATISTTDNTTMLTLSVRGYDGLYPLIKSHRHTRHNSVSQSSHVINAPSGIVSGDLLLLFIQTDSAGGNAYTMPSGWTELLDVRETTNRVLAGMAYKVAGGSEPSTYTVTTDSNVANVAAAIYRISGADTASAPQVAGFQPSTSSNAADPPNLAPGWGTDEILWGSAGYFNNILVATPPTGLGHEQYDRWANIGMRTSFLPRRVSSLDPANWEHNGEWCYVTTFAVRRKQVITLTVTADAKSKTYGDADPTLTYVITGGSPPSVTGSLARAAGENVGTYAINVGTLDVGEGYEIGTFNSANLTINARAITLTADNKSKEYGDSDPALTFSVTSGALQFSDAKTGTPSRAGGEAVGNYTISQNTASVSNASNYSITWQNGTFTITKRVLTVQPTNNSKTYGDADPTIGHTITGGSLLAGDSLTGALTRQAGEDVATYDILIGTLAVSGPEAANYDPIIISPDDFFITARDIEITLDNKSKVYGDADPAFTYQITGGALQFSDAISGTAERVDTSEDVDTYAITQGTLTITNIANYSPDWIAGQLEITPSPLIIRANAGQKKKVGDPDPVLTYTIRDNPPPLRGLFFGDTLTGALSRDPGEAKGAYAITIGTLAPDPTPGNYDITFETRNFRITGTGVPTTTQGNVGKGTLALGIDLSLL